MRLVIVSNRLPVTISDQDDKLVCKPSIGGLATGLTAFLKNWQKTSPDLEYLWLGWPGLTVKKTQEPLVTSKLQQLHCQPVFITETMMEKFNEGFCNKTLWPIFHYFTSYYSYEESYWQNYKSVNELFCQTLIELLKPDDILWIHDYHFLLLPDMVRQRFPHITIGFFLHIPFPSFEIFQILPNACRQEILLGMLGADLLGFHTHEYGQHFKKCVLRFLGHEPHMDYFSIPDRIIKVNTYPMGIDFADIQHIAKTVKHSKKKHSIIDLTHAHLKIILSIDRLDYTKGITQRLYAYEQFLTEQPAWRKAVVFVLLVAPSREGVPLYQKMKKHIDELVGRINGKFGDIEWTPILYQYRTFTLPQLVELYGHSDVALVTPLRDGMNLIAKEYLAAKTGEPGVLILSETAGSAKELLDAIIINPNSSQEMAHALVQALTMNPEEQIHRIQAMQTRLARYDIQRWGMEIINELIAMKNKQGFLAHFTLPYQIKEHIDGGGHHKKLLLLDYDGTLVPHTTDPRLAVPSEELLVLLSALSADKNNCVVIVSGRDKETLDRWLGHIDHINLVAEHGVWIKEQQDWKISKHLLNNWKPHVHAVFETYMDKLPGTFIESKEFSIAWHYRNADPEKAAHLATELADYLSSLTSNCDVRIILGNKIVEALCSGIGKDVAVMHFLAREKFDLVMAVGDDTTDEDMFKVLPSDAYSIKIGHEITSARFRLRLQNEVITLLRSLSVN